MQKLYKKSIMLLFSFLSFVTVFGLNTNTNAKSNKPDTPIYINYKDNKFDINEKVLIQEIKTSGTSKTFNDFKKEIKALNEKIKSEKINLSEVSNQFSKNNQVWAKSETGISPRWCNWYDWSKGVIQAFISGAILGASAASVFIPGIGTVAGWIAGGILAAVAWTVGYIVVCWW